LAKTLPGIRVAVDAVVFTVLSERLCILLIKRGNPPFQGRWALPGGFVEKGESLEAAVGRELAEETNLRRVFLHQLGTYGSVKRDPRGRVISVAYLALVSPDQDLASAADALGAEWHDVNSIDGLAFDHAQIRQDALRELRLEIQTTNIAVRILPEKFTLSGLQRLYEIVLEKALDKRNFRKRIRELGVLKELPEISMEGAHRPARLYSFMEKSYRPLKDRLQVFT